MKSMADQRKSREPCRGTAFFCPAHCKRGCGVTSKLVTKRDCFLPYTGVHHFTVALDGVPLIKQALLGRTGSLADCHWCFCACASVCVCVCVCVCVVLVLQHVVNE